MFTATLFFIPVSFNEWLLGSHSYIDMGFTGFNAAGMRILSYLGMFLMTYSFLAVVPKGRFRYTKIGSRTLYIYLLHGFIIKLIIQLNSYNDIDQIYQFTALFLFAVAICFILGSQTVRRLARPIIEMKIHGSKHQPSIKFQ